MKRSGKSVITILVVVCLLVLLFCLRTTEVPNTKRLVDLVGAETSIELKPDFYPPYHLLIGIPSASGKLPQFVGSLRVTDDDGKVVTIAIDSETSKESNWLQSSTETGFILAWEHQPGLSETLQPRKSHRIRISFQDMPPQGSSLWFSSMRHMAIFGDNKAR